MTLPQEFVHESVFAGLRYRGMCRCACCIACMTQVSIQPPNAGVRATLGFLTVTTFTIYRTTTAPELGFYGETAAWITALHVFRSHIVRTLKCSPRSPPAFVVKNLPPSAGEAPSTTERGRLW